MEDSSQYTTEQRDIRSTLRQAEKRPAGSPVRRAALEKLIDLAHHPSAHLKIIAAQHIKDFLKEFTDLEEDAINAVYDICEDSVPSVRIEGYKAITGLSSADAKWIKRNTDVLLQLLQSEEEDEIAVITQALVDHLELSPKITLGVLYNQLLPVDDSVDEGEHDIRMKLASLVHNFLTTAGRKAIDRSTGTEQARLYAEAFIAELPRLTDEDFDNAIRDHLLPLSVFSTSTATKHGDDLLHVIVQRIEACLKTDLQRTPPALESARPHLSLARHLVIEKRISSPRTLLNLYLSTIPRTKLGRLPKVEQVTVLCELTEILAFAENSARLDHKQSLMKQIDIVLNATPVVLEGLAVSPDHPMAIKAYMLLLSTCKQRKEQGWNIPTHIVTAVQALAAASPNDAIRQLAMSVAPPPSRRTSQTSRGRPDANSASTSKTDPPRRVMHVQQNKSSQNGYSAPKRQSNHPPDANRRLKKARTTDEGDAAESISLLQRLEVKPRVGGPAGQQVSRGQQRRVQSEKTMDLDISPPPSASQFFIKGAAASEGDPGRPKPKSPAAASHPVPQVTSLLDRLESKHQRGKR